MFVLCDLKKHERAKDLWLFFQTWNCTCTEESCTFFAFCNTGTHIKVCSHNRSQKQGLETFPLLQKEGCCETVSWSHIIREYPELEGTHKNLWANSWKLAEVPRTCWRLEVLSSAFSSCCFCSFLWHSGLDTVAAYKHFLMVGCNEGFSGRFPPGNLFVQESEQLEN